MMLETVAAVPGMVGGMLLHLKSIRKFEHSGGWIKALLEEAENERMHLMTMMELVKPKWYERLLVMLVQGIFFNSFLVCYVISPRLAHRIVGYLEEEAIHSYTEFLKDIDDGKIENVAAPAIAIDYWRLPKAATLKDVVTVIRADEAHHRDVNHFASVSLKTQFYFFQIRGVFIHFFGSNSVFKFGDTKQQTILYIVESTTFGLFCVCVCEMLTILGVVCRTFAIKEKNCEKQQLRLVITNQFQRVFFYLEFSYDFEYEFG